VAVGGNAIINFDRLTNQKHHG